MLKNELNNTQKYELKINFFFNIYLNIKLLLFSMGEIEIIQDIDLIYLIILFLYFL